MLNFIETHPESDREHAAARTYIAVDANPYRIRMVLGAFDGFILATFEGKAHELERALRFVRRQKKDVYDSVLVGIRSDRWPPGLHAALVGEFGPITWIPPHVLNQTARPFRKARQLTKFLRATYMIACASSNSQTHSPIQLDPWRQMMLLEVAYSLDIGPESFDDIPF